MRTFDVFQQLPPKGDSANLKWIGRVKAEDGAKAIKKAKNWKQFRAAEDLARWPVVEDVTDNVKRTIH